jgi:hypothetical protein
MKGGLKAEDLFPFIEQLSPEEQVRLAYYMMQVRARLGARAEAPKEAPAADGPRLELLPRRDFIQGDPEDLVHLDWG